jgi:hypothetical protein
MSAVNIRGSRLVAVWYPPKARRWCFEVYITADGTVQLNLGRLHLMHYRRPL